MGAHSRGSGLRCLHRTIVRGTCVCAGILLAVLVLKRSAHAEDLLSLRLAAGSPSPDSTILIAVDLQNAGIRSGVEFTLVFNPALVIQGTATNAGRTNGLRGTRFHVVDDSTLIAIQFDDIGQNMIASGSGAIAQIPFKLPPNPTSALLHFKFTTALLADESFAQVTPVTATSLDVPVLDAGSPTVIPTEFRLA